jgi:deferrochelatase/peroxidase EfeB
VTAGLSRRLLLGGLGAAGALGVGGALAGCSAAAPPGPVDTVEFRGARQQGIATEAQDRLAMAAFDVATGMTRADLVVLMQTWTAAAEAMTGGRPVPGPGDAQQAPPADTGEAAGLSPGHLTITVGFGPSLFDGRFGLAPRRPAELAVLPPLPRDQLRPEISNGDLVVQACSQDPQVAFHAVRNLARLGRGTVTTRWTQLGFGRTASTSTAQATPRNLMGFKDGTRNLHADDPAAMDRHVWVGAEAGQPWLTGGSYLVSRRIRMFLETWDRDVLADQENVFGRAKTTGAPLSGGEEFTPPDFTKTMAGGGAAIPVDSHVHLAAPENNGGTALLRRGYSYTDGVDPQTGMLDAGLFFIAFMRSPTQFTTLQTRLGGLDRLNEYIRHTSSAVFACPPGVAPGDPTDYWGRALLGA